MTRPALHPAPLQVRSQRSHACMVTPSSARLLPQISGGLVVTPKTPHGWPQRAAGDGCHSVTASASLTPAVAGALRGLRLAAAGSDGPCGRAPRGYARATAVALAAAQATTSMCNPRRKRVKLGKVGPCPKVSMHIERPPYMAEGSERSTPVDTYPAHDFLYDPANPGNIEVKTSEQIQKMRAACALAHEAMTVGGHVIMPSTSLDRIDAAVHDLICIRGGYPSPLGYMGFPKSVCASVNDIIAHGIPDDQLIQDGDIVNLDITVYLDGYHGSTSCMFMAGRCSKKAFALCDASQRALQAGIRVCGPGADFREIGKAVSRVAKAYGFHCVGSLSGHGIGSYFHGAPEVICVENDVDQGLMQPGMTFTVAPILMERNEDWTIREDGWTMQTSGGAWSAMFKHTVLITDTGCEVLTGPTINYIEILKEKNYFLEQIKSRKFQKRRPKKSKKRKFKNTDPRTVPWPSGTPFL